jgi:dihydroxyacetone kinase-like protein
MTVPLRDLIERSAQLIAEAADELTELDRSIGDGDHGINLKRGFDAVLGEADRLAQMEPAEALQQAGMILVRTVGGASGPLYGSLLMGMGKAAARGADVVTQLAEGIEMVRRRGRSDRGCKTMLDVLVPLLETLRSASGAPLPELVARVRETADAALEATRDMVATRGRASFLGERSRGHLDPGAASSRLLVHAVCDVLEERR